MKFSFNLLCALVVILTSCVESKNYIITEKDIIPEGTAFNSETGTIYIGSIYKQKVIAISPNGSMSDLITEAAFEDLSPIGMEVDNKRNILWVNVALAPIVNQSGKGDWKSTIMSFDLTNNQLIKKYALIEGERIFLNDLTITETGNVFATESVNGNIYKIDAETDDLSLFLELENFSFPNGIDYHGPSHCLFVSTDQGIVKVDIERMKYTLLACANDINAKEIDGLALHDNYLIGHQSSKISKFYFNESITEISKVEIFDSGDEFDGSTTGETGGGYYHYIVNSQIGSGVNREVNKLKPLDSLENVIIRVKKLK